MDTQVIEGVDLSDWQGDPDEGLIAGAGRQFAIMKASEGLGWTSRFIGKNWGEAKAAGLARVGYHFCRPSQASGREEAIRFLNTMATLVGPLAQGDGLAFDVEDPDVADDADLLAYALDFKRTVEDGVGFPPLFYSREEYMRRHNLTGGTKEHYELATCGLWLASYGSVKPESPAPWWFIAIWQRTDRDWVPGIAGPVDGDTFYGSANMLRRYGKP